VSGGLRIRYALAPRWGISFAADAATFRYTKNAVVASSGVGVGPPSLGGYFALAARPTLAATAFARVLLPLDSARTGLATGAELGGTALALAGRPWFGIDGGATLGVVTTRAAGQTHTALRTNAVAEAFISGPRAAVALGLFARAQPAPALAGISSLGLRAVVRRALGKTLWLAAATQLPLVGSDRTDLLLTLLLGYTPARR